MTEPTAAPLPLVVRLRAMRDGLSSAWPGELQGLLAILALLDRLSAAERERDGANERAQMLFEAKNHWADRARNAEQARDEAYELAAIVCDQRRPIVPVTETEWRVHKALGEAAERIRALRTKE